MEYPMSTSFSDNAMLYRQILEVTSNGVIAVDSGGRILYANPEAERLLAIRAAEAKGRLLSEAAPGLGELVGRSLDAKKPFFGQLLHVADVDLLVNATLPGADGEGGSPAHGPDVGAVCTFLELRVYENIAKRLGSYQQINRQLESIINSSEDGIWIIDSRGRVLRMNKASENIHGFTLEDVRGRHVLDLESEGLVDKVVSARVLKTRRKVTELTSIRGRQLLATGSPVFSDDGEVLFVVINERDMTELNALREQSEDSRMQVDKYKEELNKISMLELEQCGIVAESPSMLHVLQTAFRLAQLGVSNVLIRGESGTGKGLLAQYIHRHSKRKDRPFIHLNCAAIPENLLESELFGYERGAFTGALDKGKAGLVELAHEGTLFLDEIGDMPLPVQAKLLNYLDDGMVRRLGGATSRRVDCAVLAATNRDLGAMVNDKLFRQDLFYRLESFPITLQPLHERPEDIPHLAMHYIDTYNKEYRLSRHASAAALLRLQKRRYRGNVRELRNLIKRAVILSEQDLIDNALFADDEPEVPAEEANAVRASLGDLTLREHLDALEKALFAEALSQGLSTRQMARVLGIDHSTAVRKLKKHGLQASGAIAHQS
jgi:PAS domain S-box-containing protein